VFHGQAFKAAQFSVAFCVEVLPFSLLFSVYVK